MTLGTIKKNKEAVKDRSQNSVFFYWHIPQCLPNASANRAPLLRQLLLLSSCGILFMCLISTAEARPLIASYYSDFFIGKEMSNGKIFTQKAFTCATWLYPLNKRLRIKNIKTGKQVEVINTDRINRIYATRRIDLSKAAFKVLSGIDGYKQGIIKVDVERIK